MSASDAEGSGRHLVRFWSGSPHDRYVGGDIQGWPPPGSWNSLAALKATTMPLILWIRFFILGCFGRSQDLKSAK